MNIRLQEALAGKEGSYILPFFWPWEGHPEMVEPEIEKIYACGIRELCVEARPFEEFGKEGWWTYMDAILASASKRNMKVWILDDKHFPTGYANGLLEEKHPELQRHYLREHHVDVLGPFKDSAVLVPPCSEGEKILSVVAYQRRGIGEELCGEPMILEKADDCDFVYFDLPEGCFRIFVIYDTPYGSPADHRWFINMLSKESVQLLIDAVYEKHYEHYAPYFGNTIAGFFSDEPSFGCEHIGPFGSDMPFYYRTIGQAGTALPWDNSVEAYMKKEGISDPEAVIPLLWYPYGGFLVKTNGKEKDLAEIRLSYMNALTNIWKENFSYGLGNWCRAHGVKYIGHIIEDMNAHSRLGGSAGHYFRALSGQDMAGIDVVLHQIIPGMGNYCNSSPIAGGIADPAFFHYTMAQLAASLSRIEPHMHGEAMCEMFGAYGWAEGVPMMKWLTDFMLVRGINHFVPHAFSVKYPNADCPPHFYAGGCNPQYEGFAALMRYTNKAAHLLRGESRQAPGAVLYYAEAEWMSQGEFQYSDEATKLLYDAHIDYDILPLDALKEAQCEDGKLIVNGHAHSFLLIPQAKRYPDALAECVNRFEKAGVFVVVLTKDNGEAILKEIRDRRLAWDYGIEEPFLRIVHFKETDADFLMLMNEAPYEVTCELRLPADLHKQADGKYLNLKLLTGEVTAFEASEGRIHVHLAQGESEILYFGDFARENYSGPFQMNEEKVLNLKWDIVLKESGVDSAWKPYKKEAALENITGKNAKPDFSGEIYYQTKLMLKESGAYRLSLGKVGHTAKLKVNGKELGIRISEPYDWDVSEVLKPGENVIEVIVANTLVNCIHDNFSVYLQLPPSGISGPVVLKKGKKTERQVETGFETGFHGKR